MKRWSIHLFRVLGIRLELHVHFCCWLWYLFSGWQDGGLEASSTRAISLMLIFTTVVLHELGHCMAARKYGIEVPRIVILPIGGMAQFSRMPKGLDKICNHSWTSS